MSRARHSAYAHEKAEFDEKMIKRQAKEQESGKKPGGKPPTAPEPDAGTQLLPVNCPLDWFNRYGFRPVLMEAFVEFEQHQGTCYKAANWINVGRTTGRGKKSSSHQQLIPVRDTWLYPLHKNFANMLCQ